jgi:hypothetical protein
MYTKFWTGNLKGIDSLGDLGVDERRMMKWVLMK